MPNQTLTRQAREFAATITALADALPNDPKQLAHLIQLAIDDHEGSYMPSTNSGGGGSSGISDPTHTTALQPHNDQGPRILDYLTTTRAMAWLPHYLTALTAPDRAQRSPCHNGTYHQPDDNGNCTAAGCTARWPTCSPAHPAGRFEECGGHIDPGSGRCTICELSRGSWTCRSCLQIRGPGDPRKADMCANTCYHTERRARQRLATNTTHP